MKPEQVLAGFWFTIAVAVYAIGLNKALTYIAYAIHH